MNANPRLERCLTFINSLVQAGAERPLLEASSRWRAVTIARQTGAGAEAVAEELAEILQAEARPGGAPWTVFDRNLVEKVLEDHQLPRRMAKFMPEDRVRDVDEMLEDWFGLHPPFATLVEKTAETIWRLAEWGNVILIGRGSHLITRPMADVFHVRLVGSLEKRVERIEASRGMGKKAARDFIMAEDRGRRRYLHRYFGKDVDDPLQYDAVLNTDRISHKEAARIIAAMMEECRPEHQMEAAHRGN